MPGTVIFAIGFLLLTVLARSLKISFTPDLLDAVWIGSCCIICLFLPFKYIGTRFRRLILILFALFILFTVIVLYGFTGEHKEHETPLDNHYVVKTYTRIVGFMDAVTIYKIYQKQRYFPFLETYFGTASENPEKAILKGKPKLLSEKNLIVEYDGAETDTLLIIRR